MFLKQNNYVEVFRLLGCYATQGGLKPTFRNDLLVQSSRFKLSFFLDNFVPKSRFRTTLSCVITQKTEDVSSTAAKAYDPAQQACCCLNKYNNFLGPICKHISTWDTKNLK